MPLEMLLPMAAYAAAMTFTPGPNNIMLAASGVNFGFIRTIRHMLGVTAGFAALLVGCAIGLGLLFAALPALQFVLKILGASYLLWLSYRVFTARPSDDGRAGAQPLTFWEAALFQWVNPKGLIAALSAVTIYVRPGHEVADFLLLLGVFTLLAAGASMTWAAFGVGLRRFLRNPRHARIFNGSMAVLLIGSIVPMLL
jgi:threonine/homoserine/homoserine lactone efflux protein